MKESKPFAPRLMTDPPALNPDLTPGPIHRRTALLINPFYPKEPLSSFGKHVLTPGLALPSIAGATPSDWDVSFWDENLLGGPPPGDPFPRVVGITVHLTFVRRAMELAAWYRKRGAVVVFGGPHVHACPDEMMPHGDAICIGNGVTLWPRILEDVDRGELKTVYRADFTSPLEDEPLPRRDIVPAENFLTPLSLIATRGCRNRCGFCYLSTSGLRMPYQKRDPIRVAKEIKSAGAPYAVFLDNNLGGDRQYLARLCRALEPLDIIWSAAVTLDVTDEPDLVRQMAASGCVGVFIGLETLSEANLVSAGKRGPRPREYAGRIDVLHQYGIKVNGSFVFGFDDDDPGVFERTIGWIEKVGLECATFHILTPYPGTPLFRTLEAEDRLRHRNWDLYDTAHAVFHPRQMTPEQLETGYAWCYRRLFSLDSIWARRPREFKSAVMFLLGTYLYKRANHLWPFLIKHRLSGVIWKPSVLIARRKHLKYRRRFISDVPVPTLNNWKEAWSG